MGESAVKKFTNSCKKFLSAQGLHDLRAYGRGIGVEKPTTKKKEELIEDIIGVLTGAVIPIEVSKRGAPVKNDFIKPEFLREMETYKLIYLNELSVENGTTLADMPTSRKDYIIKRPKNSVTSIVFEDIEQNAEEHFAPIYKGQLANFNGVIQLLPLDCQDNGEMIIVPNRLLKDKDVKTGDIVTCHAQKKDDVLVATALLTVNALVIDSITRGDFNKNEVVYPTVPLAFMQEGRKNSLVGKYFQWLAPICKGQRVSVIAPPKSGKTTVLLEMIQSVKACNPKAEVLTLLVDQSPETVSKFRTVLRQDTLVYTTYEDEPERQVFSGEFVLDRAKRLAECGKDVVVFLDSLNSLGGAFNETEASAGGKTLAGGLERKTVHYLKKYFGASRAFAKGGSLTIIATLASATGNPADEILLAEMSNISNAEIPLDLQLALKRCYPAFAPTRTRVSVDRNEDFERLDKTLRQNFLTQYPTERLLEILDRADTYEELLSLLCTR